MKQIIASVFLNNMKQIIASVLFLAAMNDRKIG